MAKNRILGLDVIRGIAILLVLFRHGDHINFLQEIGWIGVDLFFVLSGFLVSGLLFREYKETSELRIKRFIIRRSLKIFPSFYLYTAVFLLVSTFIFLHPIDTKALVHEVLYLQNYLPGLNGHTWSLAVEEQFYIGFALLMFLAFKFKWLDKKMVIISALVAMILTVVLLRLGSSGQQSGFTQTHLRIDGILLGVLVSYCVHFTTLASKLKKKWFMIFALGMLLVVPILVGVGSNALSLTLSLFSMNIGFVLLVTLSSCEGLYSNLIENNIIAIPAKIIAFIGVHSYSIYLWHGLVKTSLLEFGLNPKITVVLYFVLAVVVGSLISMLIEQPILRMRNRIFR